MITAWVTNDTALDAGFRFTAIGSSPRSASNLGFSRRQLLREEHVGDAGKQRLPDRLFDDRIQSRKVQSR